MASTGASSSGSISSKDDPGWKYGFCPDLKDKNQVQYKFCHQKSKGGVNRFKKHIAGIRGDIAPCTKVPAEVRQEILDYINSKKNLKEKKRKEIEVLRATVNISGNDDEDEMNRDPLCAKNMDEAREWLNSFDAAENDVVPGSDLTWSLVDEAAGASMMAEPRKSSRRQGASTSQSTQMVEDEEPILASEDDDTDEDENEDAHLDFDAISSEDDEENSDD